MCFFAPTTASRTREIVRLDEAGLKPAEALRAATLDAAGPLVDVAALERVAFVMKSGIVMKTKL